MSEVRAENSTCQAPFVKNSIIIYQNTYKQVILLFNLLNFGEDFYGKWV